MIYNDDYYKIHCRECGYECRQVSGKHLAKHGLTAEQYREKYPNALLICQYSADKRSKKLSELMKGKPAHNKGKPASEEQKRKQSEAMKGKQIRLGAVLSDETKKKISDSLKNYKFTEEHRKSLRDAIQRKKDAGTYVHPLHNYVMTEEHREKSTRSLVETNKRRGKQAFDNLKESIKQYNLEFLSNDGAWWTVLCNICNTKMNYSKQMFHPSRRPDKVCPTCHPRQSGTSKEEQSLFEAVKNIYDGEIIQNTYVPVKGYELDMFLTDLKLAIEYNGLYWHACNNIASKRRDYHLSYKTKYAYKNGIKLIQVMSDEWMNHPDVVIGRLKNILNDETLLDIPACEFREVEFDNKINELYSLVDIDCDIVYGLHVGDELIATFSIIIEDDCLRIVNVANNPLYKMDTIYSLFTEFVKNGVEGINSIEVNLDAKWFESDLYKIKEAGFEYQGLSKPEIWYTDYFNRYHSDEFEGKSLEEIKEFGYDWIYDCGSLKWMWQR